MLIKIKTLFVNKEKTNKHRFKAFIKTQQLKNYLKKNLIDQIDIYPILNLSIYLSKFIYYVHLIYNLSIELNLCSIQNWDQFKIIKFIFKQIYRVFSPTFEIANHKVNIFIYSTFSVCSRPPISQRKREKRKDNIIIVQI